MPRFEKGNPGGPGRPKGVRSVDTIFRKAIMKIGREEGITDLEREIVVTLLKKAREGDMAAINTYFDRMYGRPKQTIEQENKGELAITWGLQPSQFVDDRKLQAIAVDTPQLTSELEKEDQAEIEAYEKAYADEK